MYQFEFTGRAPSKKQIMSHIKRAMSEGHDWIQLQWGENQITLEKGSPDDHLKPWHGFGWIRSIGGYDIARELAERSLDRFFPSLKNFPTIRGA
jgi:hypothetical protein